MRRISIGTAILMTGIAALSVTPRPAAQVGDPRYWAQWRGPHANAVAPNANPPLEWSEARHAIPSPVYYDGLVILMSGFQGNDLTASTRRRRLWTTKCSYAGTNTCTRSQKVNRGTVAGTVAGTL